jgi:hypothetical protein
MEFDEFVKIPVGSTLVAVTLRKLIYPSLYRVAPKEYIMQPPPLPR